MEKSIDRRYVIPVEFVSEAAGGRGLKNYEHPSITPVSVESEGCIMAGSVTDYAVRVNNVKVEDYSYGFSSDGGITDTGFTVSFED